MTVQPVLCTGDGAGAVVLVLVKATAGPVILASCRRTCIPMDVSAKSSTVDGGSFVHADGRPRANERQRGVSPRRWQTGGGDGGSFGRPRSNTLGGRLAGAAPGQSTNNRWAARQARPAGRTGSPRPLSATPHVRLGALALTASVEAGGVKSGDLVMFEAIGGGLAWGAGLVRIGRPSAATSL